MGKIDEVKEVLNSLRVVFSIIVGFIALLTGALVGNYRNGYVDFFFWLGVVTLILLSISLVTVIHYIVKKTREIKDL